MTRILFIQPNKLIPQKTINLSPEEFQAERTDGFTRAIPSLPAMTILGALKEHEVSFVDATADKPEQSWKFNNYLDAIGLNEEEISQIIEDRKPNFVLVNSMFTSEYMSANRIADIARKAKTPVIMGGHQVTLRPEWHEEHCDVMVMGEGEQVIGNIIKNFPELKSKRIVVPRLSSLNSPWNMRAVLFNSEINRYPLKITTRNPKLYFPEGSFNGTGVLYFSRGCPHACKYCNATDRDGERIRHMSLERMISITEDYLDLGINVFQNESDTFGMHELDRKYLEWIAEQRKGGREINLINTNSFFARYFFPSSRFDSSRIDLLKRAGFRTITVSIESFNEEFNKGKLKVINLQMFKDCFGYMKNQGLNVDVYMMYLFPEQTEAELKKDIRNIEFLSESIDASTWRSLTYFPGTEYYDWALRTGKFTEDQYKNMIEKGHSFYHLNEGFNFSRIKAIPKLP